MARIIRFICFINFDGYVNIIRVAGGFIIRDCRGKELYVEVFNFGFKWIIMWNGIRKDLEL